MNTFKKKSLYLAVAGASALGAGTASAVTLNADGLGEVLLYPYYTVRETSPGNAYNSLLSVVNSTASAKAVKVRFLEGKNSREVLDFNLYLSKKDVWVTAIIPTSDGAGIVTPDNSCTDGIVSQDENNPTPFVNYAYIGDNDDPANDDLDRTREGYVEIIEMGGMWGYGAAVVTHDSSGVPRNCSYIRGSFTGGGGARADYFTSNPGGGLFGTMTLINVNTGIDFGYDATALAGFSDNQIWYAPGLPNPNFADASPPFSLVVQLDDFNGNNNVWLTNWATAPANGVAAPINAVSAVLMHDNIYNEFVLDKATASGTDWVVTFPTKTFYYDKKASDKELKVLSLFQRNFKSTGACDDISLIRYDREEKQVKTTTTFSPPPPTKTDSLCWEANVISFNSSNVLASKNVANLPTTFEHGWAELAFPSGVTGIPPTSQIHALIGGNTTQVVLTAQSIGSINGWNFATYYGLPVLGFAAVTFSNGNIGGALSNYGGNFDHMSTRRVSPGN